MIRVIQISDTHLSPSKRHFADNWPPIAEWISIEQPDLVIHTGDLTIDGADTETDLEHCARVMRDLGVPFRAVPGNHDGYRAAAGCHRSTRRSRPSRYRSCMKAG